MNVTTPCPPAASCTRALLVLAPAVVLLMATASCADSAPSGHDMMPAAQPGHAAAVPAVGSGLTSRAPAAYAVLGHFEAEVNVRTGITTIRMVEAPTKSVATPGYDDGLTQNRDPGDFTDSREGTFRFEQDTSGNGQSVAACEDFWTDGWGTFDDTWPFWKPAGARPGWLASLEGDPGDNRFCTNFRLRNDYNTAIRDLWIIVDGFTIPSVRAFADAAPRTVPNPVPGDPDINLEPFSTQGMFRYGSFAPGETINGQWYFYFGGAPVSSFNVRGRLVDVLAEVCGNDQDNNGDGLVDNGCGTYQAEADCILDADCLSDSCIGGIPGEFGSFTLGECAQSAIGGSCFDDDDCVGIATCNGGDAATLTTGTCTGAPPALLSLDLNAAGVSYSGDFLPGNETFISAVIPCSLASSVTIVRDDFDEVTIRWTFTGDDTVQVGEDTNFSVDAFLTSNGECDVQGGLETSSEPDADIWDLLPLQPSTATNTVFNLLGIPYDGIRALAFIQGTNPGPTQFSGVEATRALRGGGTITWELCACTVRASTIVPGDRSGDPEVAAEEVDLFSIVLADFGEPCTSDPDCNSGVCSGSVCLHASGLDAGCFDSALGSCEVAFASPSGTDGAGCGNLASNPCRRPSVAMSNQTGRTSVALAIGNYNDDIILEGSQAPSLLGGFSDDFTQRSFGDFDRADITATESTGLLVRDLANNVLIADVNITGGNGVSGPAIGLEVRDAGSFLEVQRTRVTAGNGADGLDGTVGTPGDNGENGLPSGNRTGAAGGTGACPGGAGGNGAQANIGESGSNGVDAPGADAFSGGAGGEAGPGAGNASFASGDDGEDGFTPGHSLFMGSPAVHGSFSGADDSWVNNTAQAGASGDCGVGGGGGGGAGAFTSAGPPFAGGGGGGGGAGGMGGGGGTGGSSGAPSIAIFTAGSTVDLVDVALVTGNGGNGGTGGTGGAGGTGGTGGDGFDPGTGGIGGDGGNGGEGTPGGCGGSGNGGWTVGIWRQADSAVNETNVTIVHGAPGMGGGAVAGCTDDLPNDGGAIDRL